MLNQHANAIDAIFSVLFVAARRALYFGQQHFHGDLLSYRRAGACVAFIMIELNLTRAIQLAQTLGYSLRL